MCGYFYKGLIINQYQLHSHSKLKPHSQLVNPQQFWQTVQKSRKRFGGACWI